MNYFRNNLSYLRKKNGYSLDTFADMVDKDIRWIEHCERKLIEPDIDSLILLSDIFKVPVDKMLREDIEKKTKAAKKKK